ncbi:ATP-dependent helicase [Candidatus Omnitrophota bacterium]
MAIKIAGDFSAYYNKLNVNQKRAVDITEGPLLILAGPGTGKTELLSVRAANIIRQKKALPENLLILTYTNAAAKAMKERLVKILGPEGYDIEAGTFHSFANSIILDSDEAANYVQDKIQMAADKDEDIEQIKLLEYILDNTDGIDAIRPFRAPYFYRRDIQSKISELKKDGIRPSEFREFVGTVKSDGVYIEDKHIPRLKALATIYKLYEEYKNGNNKEIFDARGRYDLDDMIMFALEALEKEDELRRVVQHQYKYIMVDEFQDTNGAQLNLLFKLIHGDRPNICCVGDDDQSIYRFQGASVGNFKILKEKFSDIEVVSLDKNYRSTKDIIDLSGKIISHLPKKERMVAKILEPQKKYKDKAIEFHELTTETEELLFATEKIEEARAIIERSSELSDDEKKLPYNNIAVLVRKRKDLLKVIDALLRAGIPYATDGKEDICHEKRVRQMLDVLNLAHTIDPTNIRPQDAVFYRILTSDYFNIQMSDLLKFIGYVNSKRTKQRESKKPGDITLFSQFMREFDTDYKDSLPTKKDTAKLSIAKRLGLSDPNSLHCAGWAIKRLRRESEIRPVHAILMQYIDDAGVYKYILKQYSDNNILKIRDLRALSSFINMVKNADLRDPGMKLIDFINEIQTKSEHGMPLTGNLVTLSQEGVRVYTAHGSKGLEFHTVIIPFCLQNKNWPARPMADKIPIPPQIFKTKERASDKKVIKELNFFDETRLFYVASTRAKSQLIYSCSPTEDAVSSSYLSSVGLNSDESKSQAREEEVLSRFLKHDKKEDPFVGTEAILKDMVSNLKLNPTSLNNYISCKRKFLYDDILLLPSSKKLGLSFGNCVHKALEDTYRHLMDSDRFPSFDFFKESFKAELYYQGVEDSIKLRCLSQLETLHSWYELQSRNPVKPLGLEKKLAIMLDDSLVFTGKYDKTEIVDEEKKLVRVVDYKTGKPDNHIKKILNNRADLGSNECDGYLRQLIAYKLLFDRDKDQNRGCRVAEGMLVFVEPAKSSVLKYGLKKGEFVNNVVKVSDDMVDNLIKVIKDSWRSIKGLNFEKLPERDEDITRCGGCDYKNICWD